MNLIKQLEKEQIDQFKLKTKNIPKFNIGDVISIRIILSKKTKRQQIFTGVCISLVNKGFKSSFTLRNYIYKEGVEKTFPLYSSLITNIKVLRTNILPNTRRSKLYNLKLNRTI